MTDQYYDPGYDWDLPPAQEETYPDNEWGHHRLRRQTDPWPTSSDHLQDPSQQFHDQGFDENLYMHGMPLDGQIPHHHFDPSDFYASGPTGSFSAVYSSSGFGDEVA